MAIKTEFEKFKKIPFPDNSASSEELSDIFYELVSYDSFIASQIDIFLTGKKDVDLNYEPMLENKINNFLQTTKKNDPDYKLANIMLSYVGEIKQLLLIARKEQ